LTTTVWPFVFSSTNSLSAVILKPPRIERARLLLDKLQHEVYCVLMSFSGFRSVPWKYAAESHSPPVHRSISMTSPSLRAQQQPITRPAIVSCASPTLPSPWGVRAPLRRFPYVVADACTRHACRITRRARVLSSFSI
jgi:hypothetical protein